MPEFKGLSTAEAAAQLKIFGKNELKSRRRNFVFDALLGLATEPMFLLLAAACALYFLLGDRTEAVMMLVSILFVASIEVFQEIRSNRAIAAMQKMTAAAVRVLRDGAWIELPAAELVPRDVVQISEGEQLAADGLLIQKNDLSLDESMLTGESLAVEKDIAEGKNKVFAGSTVAAGQGIFEVSETADRTELGKMGRSIEAIDPAPTPLQLQIKSFVKKMGWLGLIAFLIVFGLNFWLESDVWKALLFSLTVAMALIPEEIPVAFSAFMGLGALRMAKRGILAKQPKTVEALGSATVICLDKTGTITENRMALTESVDFSGRDQVLETALLASEIEPFDAMEKALLGAFLVEKGPDFRASQKLVHEYALDGLPPMMTHVWEKEGQKTAAGKGALERILAVCRIEKELAEIINRGALTLSEKGFRVLGVASAAFSGAAFPEKQDDFEWKFEGLVAFFDPPKANARESLEVFKKAGIRIVMLTGDHPATAQNIARSVGIIDEKSPILTGEDLMKMDEPALQKAVAETAVFARMFPMAKLRAIEALKKNGETVAMSGDGANDGPALRAAQIGVAMGRRGTDVARSAAALVLIDDDLGHMAEAIGMGRRIYDNLRKAIRYVLAIHLPIVMAVLLPLIFGWQWPHILLPLHVIFLEIVMDPTVAIAFEAEPAEPGILEKPPRSASAPLFSGSELVLSLLVGTVIGAVVLAMHFFAVRSGKTEEGARAIAFATMSISTMLLALSFRSFERPVWQAIFWKNRSMPIVLGLAAAMLVAILEVPFLAKLFKMEPLSLVDLGLCAAAAAGSLVWFEVWKVWKMRRKKA